MENYLKELEYQSIDIIRDVVFSNNTNDIVCFYSVGKDSSVLLHLFKKAFYPHKIPIKFLHIDTGWKFPEMYEFRDKISKEIDLLIFKHPAKLNPYKDGRKYTDVMKTEALKLSQKEFGYKIAFGGARRDEEKSRAKERIVSTRDINGYWDVRNQNPEIARGEIKLIAKDTDDLDYLFISKTYDGSEIGIVINFSQYNNLVINPSEYGFSKVTGQIVIESNQYVGEQKDGSIIMPPFSIVILKK